MTQEDKYLLLKDLCTRLPYGVKVHIKGEYKTPRNVYTIYKEDKTITYFKGFDCFEEDIENIKLYLRPMSSMTEEELYEVQEILGKGVEIHDVFISIVDSSINTFSYLELQAVFDWLNAHHFDYRGLIEKGIAIEAPEGMYNIK